MANPFTTKTAGSNLMPGEWDVQQRQIDYDRRMAEQLGEDTAMPQGQMVGGIYVAPSWTQQLAKALNPILARRGMESANERQRALDDKRMAERSQTLEAFSKALHGTPEQVNYLPEGIAGPPQIAPAIPGNRDAAMAELGKSRDPMLQQLYMAQMLKEPDKPVVVGRTLKDPRTGKTIGYDETWQAEQQAALQSRREIADQASADRRMLAGLAHGAAGRAPAGYRFTTSGDLEAIPGGPADAKAQAAAQRQADGATDVSVALSTLRDAYDRLEKGGGITSTDSGPIANAGAALSSSAVGQATGKLFGTKNQSARNDIAMSRPALLAALMKATGMSAKQMDSNAELKLWLSTATDPTLDVESNRRALDNIERKYMRGGAAVPSPSGGMPSADAIDAEIARRQKGGR